VRFLLTLALCSWPAPAQTNQEAEPNMACVERLQLPVYPRLAATARISGSTTAKIAVASDGSFQANVSGHPLLTAAVDHALRASSFHKSCGGKSVTLVFNFVLSDYYPDGRVQDVSFGYPNQFWILPQIVRP
jgi:outer membrane biosynthesis protein TonB